MLPAIRSMLFVSGEKPERFPKAFAAGADLVCIDLEDAVAPALKQRARTDVLAFAAEPPAQGLLAVRFNALRTREGLADVQALLASAAHPDVIVLPKVESAAEVALAHAWVGDRCRALVALVESPLGVENAAAIAAAPGLGALMLGGADLSSELGAAFGWDGLFYARTRLLNATRRVAALGFDCKAAIHPSQVPVIHAAFRPAESEVARARALLQALEQRGADGAGAFLFEGRMVDGPVLAHARRVVARAA